MKSSSTSATTSSAATSPRKKSSSSITTMSSITKMFLGNEAAAKKLAELDGNHYTIESIDKHTGDPLLRSSMRFLVTFADKEQIWKIWSAELFATVQYEDYIRQHRPLYPLLSPSKPSLPSKLRPTLSLSKVSRLVTTSSSTSASTAMPGTRCSTCLMTTT